MTAPAMSILSVVSSVRLDGRDTIVLLLAPIDTTPERILSQVKPLYHRRCTSPMVVHADGLFVILLSTRLRATLSRVTPASTNSGKSSRSNWLTFPAFGCLAASLGLVWGLAPAPSHSRRLAGPHHGRNVAINDVVLLIGGASVRVMRGRRPRLPLIATFVLPLGTRGSELVDKFSERFANDRCGALSWRLRALAGRRWRDVGCEPRPLIQLLVRRRGVSCPWGMIQSRGWGRRRRCSVSIHLGRRVVRGWLRSFVVLATAVGAVPLEPVSMLLLQHPILFDYYKPHDNERN